ncbi:MAG: isochorismatase [Phycisphaerae bacterium]|nr:MAG: isochorismatase [Phycisphaerae bacterium]
MLITRDNSSLLLIDVQTRLLPQIHEAESMVATNAFLLKAAHLFGVPIVATVQYVAGLGPTHPQLQDILSGWDIEPIEKATFSALQDETCKQKMTSLNRSHVVVVGIESHVCVQQSVLDLVEAGFRPVVVRDAISSRSVTDLETSIRRMEAAGAVVTTAESLAFGWCRESGTPEFKEMLGYVKDLDAAKQNASNQNCEFAK